MLNALKIWKLRREVRQMAEKKKSFLMSDEELDLPVFDPIDGAAKIPVDITRGQKPRTSIRDIPPELFIPYQNKQNSDFSRMPSEKVQSMAESFLTIGVIQPVVARIYDENRYELLAGEHRWEACKIANIDVPTIVYENCDDILAEQIFSLTNILSRDKTPRDLINGWWHYDEALKKAKHNKREDITILSPKDEMISYRQIHKYVRCHSLADGLLQMVDDGIYSIDVADILSGLSHEQQLDLCDWKLPLHREQARMLKALSDEGNWDYNTVLESLRLKKAPRPEQVILIDKALKKQRTRITQQIKPTELYRLDSILEESLVLYFDAHPEDKLL